MDALYNKRAVEMWVNGLLNSDNGALELIWCVC